MYESALKEFGHYGVKVSGVEIDVNAMLAQKVKAVTGLTSGIEHLFKKNKVTYTRGWGKITGPNEVSVAAADGTSSVLTAKNIIIATGSEPTPLPPLPVDNARQRIVDSTGALDLTTVPKRMVVVGGGVIGLELGSVWRRLGTEVTVVEYADSITPGMDKEITQAFLKILKKQGMKFLLQSKVTASNVTDSGVTITYEPSKGGAAQTLDCDVVLVSTGRRPFTKGLGLPELGVALDKAGRVVIDDHFRTNIPSVFAIGDVVRGAMLAHKAEEEGVACVENLVGKSGHVNYDAVPSVIYTHPEVAYVGKTEEELIAAGVAYAKGSFPFMANSRARTVDDTDGMVKLLAEKGTDRLLGAHIIGPNAGELIAECVMAMEYGGSSEDIARTCHAHPTLSEAVKEAALATHFKAIHF